MKKLFLAFACLAAVVMTSCKKDVMSVDASKLDNTVKKCWEYTVTTTAGSASASETSFVWCTERECVTIMQEAIKFVQIAGVKVKGSYKEASAKTDESCYELAGEKD